AIHRGAIHRRATAPPRHSPPRPAPPRPPPPRHSPPRHPPPRHPPPRHPSPRHRPPRHPPSRHPPPRPPPPRHPPPRLSAAAPHRRGSEEQFISVKGAEAPGQGEDVGHPTGGLCTFLSSKGVRRQLTSLTGGDAAAASSPPT